jgi:hypothetical protein
VSESPLTRSKDLRARALLTNALAPRSAQRMAQTITERREALDLLEDMEFFLEGVLREHRALTTRVFELASHATRGTNGHSWTTDLPNKANATPFYQALCALVKHLRSRSTLA